MDERSERIARHFEIPLLIGAGLVIPLLLLDERGVDPAWRDVARTLDWGIWLAEIEQRSTWDGIWWCVTTMTTLGSNIQPHTAGGRVLAVVAVLVGISFVALLTGAIARRFLSQDIEDIEEEIAGEVGLVEEDLL